MAARCIRTLRSLRAFDLLLWLALVVVLVFLLLPLVAIFVRTPPQRLVEKLGDRAVLDALVVTAKTSLLAQILIVLGGTPAAYLLARKRFTGRNLALAVVELPIVMPPAVAGVGLFAAFGRFGLLGDRLRWLNVELPFTQLAVVFAVLVVAGPLYVRTAVAAFDAVDPDVLDASRTLGAGPARTFVRVALPLAANGLFAGVALSAARGVGEFGATITFAGSFRGSTQTLALLVYAESQSDFEGALAVGALLIGFSFATLVLLRVRSRWLSANSIRGYTGSAFTSIY